ncbi:Methionine import ATP-binding protein MetN [Ewingella americana]|uniref:Methionine import ATP-binding protein MetN n=1 Tax=Ewingella americana TaxID=41202 RepID=A0A377NIQ9_9GAMM|nr:Methionine import ATP-binding protein MetN [Ewingella americana]
MLLADEATSGLDPDATTSILTLLKQLRDQFGLSIILITHEMDVVRRAADAVAEIRDGQLLQQGSLRELLATPGSRIGQQLFPLQPLAANGDLQLQLTYGDRAIATDWISQVSQQHQIQVDVLAAHVEQVGRDWQEECELAVRFNQRPVGLQVLIQQLYQLGINAELIESQSEFKEAV